LRTLQLRYVAQVPLAENARDVAGALERLRNRGGLEGEPLAFQDGVGDAIAKLVSSGHQRRPRGGARGADVKVGEPDALVMDPIDIGGLQHRIPVTRHVAIALVVGENENDVGLKRRLGGRTGKAAHGQNRDGHRQPVAAATMESHRPSLPDEADFVTRD